MNDAGREKLVAAAMSGVKQITGRLSDGEDGLCALGVLGVNAYRNLTEIAKQYDLNLFESKPCELCTEEGFIYGEVGLIGHYNDHHKFDFLTIARKI